jgi:hypothetical protein
MNRSKRIVPIVAAAVVITASVVLVGVSGTAAVGIVAWLRADG